MTTTAINVDHLIERLHEAEAILETLEGMDSPSTPPVRPRSTAFPWAAVALGAVIGAAVVAIAGWVL